MANALPILLLGGAAALMLAGKKKSKPSPTPVPAPEGAPSGDQSYVNIAFDTSPQSIFLGDTAVAAKVSGVESDGFVYPLPDETLANWYTRVAYWGAYPHYTGAPYEIPPLGGRLRPTVFPVSRCPFGDLCPGCGRGKEARCRPR
jgi:hypothetical protein